MERLSRRQIAEIGVAGVLAFDTALIGAILNRGNASTPTIPSGTEIPQRIPDATISQNSVIELEPNLTPDQSLVVLGQHYNLDFQNQSGSSIRPEYVFELTNALSLFPDSFYKTWQGRLQAVVALNPSEEQLYQSNGNKIYFESNPTNEQDISFVLSHSLFLRADAANNHQAENAVIQLLGGQKFLDSPASVYPALQNKDISADALNMFGFGFYELNHKADSKELVGALSSDYMMGWDYFGQSVGKIFDNGVDFSIKKSQADYQDTKTYKIYQVLKAAYKDRVYYYGSLTSLQPAEDAAIAEINFDNNVQVEEADDIVMLRDYLFAKNPDSAANLSQYLQSLPDSFFATPTGEKMKIIISTFDPRDTGSPSFDAEEIILPTNDLLSANPDASQFLYLDLVTTLVQRKDYLSGDEGTRALVDSLGGDKFINYSQDSYPVIRKAFQEGMSTGMMPVNFPFSLDMNGQINTEFLLTDMALDYTQGEATFFDMWGHWLSPGVSVGDKNYPESEVHKAYLALKAFFNQKEYYQGNFPPTNN